MSNPFQKFQFRTTKDVPQQSSADISVAPKQPRASSAPPLLARNNTKRKRVDNPPSPPKGVPEKLGCKPLRLIIVGHNPSEHAWRTGHYYSNPSNRMWPILKESGIAPAQIRGAEDDDLMPELTGVGFTDVGSGTPGTNSADFSSSHFVVWAESFYQRLRNHMQEASASIGCTCGTCGAPALVAFSGKRHFTELLKLKAPPPPLPQTLRPFLQPPATSTTTNPTTATASPTTITHTAATASRPTNTTPPAATTTTTTTTTAHTSTTTTTPRTVATSTAAFSSTLSSDRDRGARQGKQKAVGPVPLGPQQQLPPGWPLPPTTKVWVMTSTSGASALTNAARIAPWLELSQQLQQIPWPRQVQPACSTNAPASQML